MFNLIYESTTNNEGYDLVRPNRYINCMASVKELFAILDEKELNDPNIGWECVQVTCYALVDEWYTRVYENCHTNVVSNNSLGFTQLTNGKKSEINMIPKHARLTAKKRKSFTLPLKVPKKKSVLLHSIGNLIKTKKLDLKAKAENSMQRMHNFGMSWNIMLIRLL